MLIPALLTALVCAGVDATEVTVADFSRCVKAGACSANEVTRSDWGPGAACNWNQQGREQHPMNCVNQAQAAGYCRSVGRHLPTDAEWEAALGPAPFPWGDAEPDATRVCLRKMDQGGTCPVGASPAGAGPGGVLDLAGNVAEWTSSRSCSGCSSFIHRGGAWGGGWGSVVIARFGHLRGRDEGAHRGSYLGFRCAEGPGGGVEKVTLPPAPALQLDVHVLTRKDGTGNEQWTEAFTRQVLERASSLSHGDVRFALGSFDTVADDGLFETKTQPPILDWALTKATVGRLTVAISNPRTTDTAGFARVNSAIKDFKPHLVMRARKNDGSDADVFECASILLHEFGHTMGFAHDGTPDALPYNTDDWWSLPPARDRVQTVVGWFAMHDRGPGAGAREAFTCKVGAPNPDTDQLFDPPTNAPTPAECAQRCLDWPGCKATAQPTWANARCFLFGAQTKIVKNKGWNNVDVCWKK